MLFLSLILGHAWNSFSGFLNTVFFLNIVFSETCRNIRVLQCLRKGSNELRLLRPTVAKSKCPGNNISDPQAYPTFFPASRHLTKSPSHMWWWLLVWNYLHLLKSLCNSLQLPSLAQISLHHQQTLPLRCSPMKCMLTWMSSSNVRLINFCNISYNGIMIIQNKETFSLQGFFFPSFQWKLSKMECRCESPSCEVSTSFRINR